MSTRQLRNRRLFAAIFTGILTCAAQASAQDDPVQWSIMAVPQKTLARGATFTLKLLARIDPGWHLYALDQEEGGPISTEISLAGASFLTLGPVHASKPIQLLDPNFNRRVGLYVVKAEFSAPLMVATDAPMGSQHASFHIRFQCCNETTCRPPRTAAVEFSVSIKAKR